MTPGVRKFALLAHVSSSVGWLGAVVSFVVLSIVGLKSHEAETVRAAYIAMNLIGEYALVPFSFAALVTGIVQAVGTPWGLFRYYWVVLKLVLTIGGTLLLLLHQFTEFRGAAERVMRSSPGALPDVGPWGTDLVVKSSAAVLLLLVITVVAIYKPWGIIPYGRAQRPTSGADAVGAPLPRGLKVFLLVLAFIVAALLATHLTGGMHHLH